MSSLSRHLLAPLLVPVFFVAVATLPTAVLGCRNRGLVALAIALGGVAAALAAAIRGASGRIRGRAGSGWWLVSAGILALPALYLVLLYR